MIDQTAILIGALVEVADGGCAEVSEVVAEFLKVFLAQYFRLFGRGTASHGTILVVSYFVRHKIISSNAITHATNLLVDHLSICTSNYRDREGARFCRPENLQL